MKALEIMVPQLVRNVQPPTTTNTRILIAIRQVSNMALKFYLCGLLSKNTLIINGPALTSPENKA